MIGKLIIALLNLISKVVSVLLYPIDALAFALIPNISSVINSITYYLYLPGQVMGWVFELFHVPPFALTLIVSYWVFKYAIVGATYGIKKTITLYQRFKP